MTFYCICYQYAGSSGISPLLSVCQVTPGGKAARGGVKQDDYLLAINGDETEGLLHFDAQQMIKATGMSLQLKLARCVCVCVCVCARVRVCVCACACVCVWRDVSLASPTHFCKRREGSGELCIQAVSHQNAISWMT